MCKYLWFAPAYPHDTRSLVEGKKEMIKKMDGHAYRNRNMALFTSEKFYKIGIVALSFIFDKYCPIMY